jgi:hypothetical protein
MVVVFAGCAGMLVVGCGSSGSTTSSQQLEAAQRKGEEVAHERDRLNGLQHQVRHLRRQVNRGHSAVAPQQPAAAADTQAVGSTQAAGSGVLRSFHAPSGNVSCEVLEDGALCSVISSGETFSFLNGEAARIDSGSELPGGYGELAPYGSSVGAGSVSCAIPQSAEPRGVRCTDSASGHGFEASRVTARQEAF